ncbi:MAG: HAD-IA family hydrolase [Oscillospiraceae bacterium]|jgi:putative hydrolase of the HAD superfamily|nr:HAD-IA family hydrolase [Oscillospiraceae bacterium]
MKTIVFDMYGVIIKESKGNFIPYTFNHFPLSEHARITKVFRVDRLFTKAGNGEITSDEFLTALGYNNPQFHMRDYIENHLTIDEDFYTFAESIMQKYKFALLTNDISDWSKYITKHYKLNQYFPIKIVSADVHCYKPEKRIYEITLEQLGVPGNECIFIDNNVENLQAAREFDIDIILFNRDNESYNGKTVYSFTELAQLLKLQGA